eukprot:jgi/Mesvir1/3248/Mv16389-RA.3
MKAVESVTETSSGGAAAGGGKAAAAAPAVAAAVTVTSMLLEWGAEMHPRTRALRRRAFDVYAHMRACGLKPVEVTFTNMARVACSMGEGDKALAILEEMEDAGIRPKLRSFFPPLESFCRGGDLRRAFAVYDRVRERELMPGEAEYRQLALGCIQLARRRATFLREESGRPEGVVCDNAILDGNAFDSKMIQEAAPHGPMNGVHATASPNREGVPTGAAGPGVPGGQGRMTSRPSSSSSSPPSSPGRAVLRPRPTLPTQPPSSSPQSGSVAGSPLTKGDASPKGSLLEGKQAGAAASITLEGDMTGRATPLVPTLEDVEHCRARMLGALRDFREEHQFVGRDLALLLAVFFRDWDAATTGTGVVSNGPSVGGEASMQSQAAGAGVNWGQVAGEARADVASPTWNERAAVPDASTEGESLAQGGQPGSLAVHGGTDGSHHEGCGGHRGDPMGSQGPGVADGSINGKWLLASAATRWRAELHGVTREGVCEGCCRQLRSISLLPEEASMFAGKIADIAAEREYFPNGFQTFKDWLVANGPFDVIVDGANVAMYGQNFEEGFFSFTQLHEVVQSLRRRGHRPLVVLHNRRTTGPLAEREDNAEILARLRRETCLYCTPDKSNDDWYWIYAAVVGNGFLVSNDLMRDHLCQMLAPRYFLKWRERHQVGAGAGGPDVCGHEGV